MTRLIPRGTNSVQTRSTIDEWESGEAAIMSSELASTRSSFGEENHMKKKRMGRRKRRGGSVMSALVLETHRANKT